VILQRGVLGDNRAMVPPRAGKAAPFVMGIFELTGCLTLALAGCASHTIPDERGVAPSWAPVPGYYGQTVRVVTGSLVETIELDEGRPLNLQVNVEDLRQGETGFPHQLTIGHFSRWLGSGFARGQNIYYRKRIDTEGVDTFQVDGITHYVRWTMTSQDPDPGEAVFAVSIGRGRAAAP
jgi:hypothetical protein